VFNHPENELSLLPTNHAQGKKPKKEKKARIKPKKCNTVFSATLLTRTL
jgi:hypothetical protein